MSNLMCNMHDQFDEQLAGRRVCTRLGLEASERYDT